MHHRESGADGFLSLLRKLIGPIKVHVDNEGIIDGLRKGEKECLKPRAGDAVLCTKNWEIITWSGRKRHFGRCGACEGAPHEERKENMSQFERFVTEGNEKADELARAGAMCSITVCGQLPLLGGTIEGL